MSVFTRQSGIGGNKVNEYDLPILVIVGIIIS